MSLDGGYPKPPQAMMDPNAGENAQRREIENAQLSAEVAYAFYARLTEASKQSGLSIEQRVAITVAWIRSRHY